MKQNAQQIIKNKDSLRLNQAVILAGGRGERLRPLTDKVPKPMLPVNGAPFLDYLINSVIQVGIERVLILTGYKGQIINERYRNLVNDGIAVECSSGAVNDQTGRRLLNAYGLLDGYFLLLYGDNYWRVELDKMLNLYKEKKAKVLTTVFSNRQGRGEYGYENNIELGKDAFVKQYDKQRKANNLNGVDIGYFIVDKTAIDPYIDGNISFEEYFLPMLISEKQLVGYITDTPYYYITNINSLKNFESAVIKENIKPISGKLLEVYK